MYQSLITLRYAKALYKKAEEDNVLDNVLKDSQLIRVTFSENAELEEAIRYPLIYPSKKRDILKSLFESRIQPVTLRFLFLIVEHNRGNYIQNIFRNFIDIYNESQGIKTVFLTTAVKVGKKEEESIKNLVKKYFYAHKVNFSEQIDKKIIGGFIIQIEDQLLDASVRRQLEKVRDNLTHSSHIA